MPKSQTVLGSIPASSQKVKSEGRQIKQCWIKYIKNPTKNSPYIEFGMAKQTRNSKFRKRYCPFNLSTVDLGRGGGVRDLD